MLGSLKGLATTLLWMFHKPVTAQYPQEHLPVQKRFMGFPALPWDEKVDEPYCTSCMVCIRYCPTQCMSATMKDNPLYAEGKSHRKKIIEAFEINMNRCILCGICVDVCNFDAIVMSHEHELSSFARNGARMNLSELLKLGLEFQQETGWQPSNPKNTFEGAMAAKVEGAKGEKEEAPEEA